jgi:hypothetical protein
MKLRDRARAAADKLARRQALKLVVEQTDELKVEFDDGTYQLERLFGAPPAKVDVFANLPGIFEDMAVGWWSRGDNQDRFTRAAGGRLEETTPGGPLTLRAGALPDSLTHFGAWGPDTQAAFLGDAMTANVMRHLDRVGYEGGAPWTVRIPLIAELQAKLKAIEDEHTLICDEAAEEGIALDYLPHVAQRRLAAGVRDARNDREHQAHLIANHAAIRRAEALSAEAEENAAKAAALKAKEEAAQAAKVDA